LRDSASFEPLSVKIRRGSDLKNKSKSQCHMAVRTLL